MPDVACAYILELFVHTETHAQAQVATNVLVGQSCVHIGTVKARQWRAVLNDKTYLGMANNL